MLPLANLAHPTGRTRVRGEDVRLAPLSQRQAQTLRP